ncbi:MAG: hypothetical protein B7Y02_07795 [Rhodobacterales bacterium 17-64-5]|nr:MAG: hypothetical protein B7Y02_07795 [Rhodobacterales bacterium 17-64-5]
MQQSRFDVSKAPIPPLRAEPRFSAQTDGASHIQGVPASPGGLIRSTLLAGASALAILVLFWLPAEYGVDPTGVGGVLGLTEMGDIKAQLAGEAAAQDAAAATQAGVAPDPVPASGDVAVRLDRIEAKLAQIAAVIGADPQGAEAAPAPDPVAETAPPAETASEPAWRDELVFTLAPTEAKEVKLVMAAGDVASFEWVAEGGGVNYSQHGDDGGTQEVRFEDGRASPGQDGTMTAPFAGKYGWFWRNRGDAVVKVTLRVGGDYAQMIEVE